MYQGHHKDLNYRIRRPCYVIHRRTTECCSTEEDLQGKALAQIFHVHQSIDIFSIHMQDLTAKGTPPFPPWTASVPQ